MAKLIDVVAKIQEIVGDGYEVSGFDSFKNNRGGKDVGFTIRPQGMENAPVIYLSAQTLADGDEEDLAKEILTRNSNAKIDRLSVVTPGMITKEYVLRNVVYRLIGQKTNQKLLKECPYKPFCDLALVYYVKVGESKDNYTSFRIRNDHLDAFGLTVEEIDEAAIRNTAEEGISFFDVTNMNRDAMLLQLAGKAREAQEIYAGPRVPAKYDVGIEAADICGRRMYTLTNRRQLNGAAMMALPGILKQIADRAEGDLIVFPGSIHEVSVIRYSSTMSRARCNQTVRDANRLTVAPEDILSDHAYRYRRDLGMLTIL